MDFYLPKSMENSLPLTISYGKTKKVQNQTYG